LNSLFALIKCTSNMAPRVVLYCAEVCSVTSMHLMQAYLKMKPVNMHGLTITAVVRVLHNAR